jgi:regulator of protease activity HflC (stomatin/prohibitin superfamily)
MLGRLAHSRLSLRTLPKVANHVSQRTYFSQVHEYEKALVFQAGRYVGEKGPGIRLDVPVLHKLHKVDTRIQTLTIPPQELMTKDNVTVHVDAVSFFQVVDPKKALLNNVDYKRAVNEAAQTSLRSQLSRNTFDELLSDREEAGQIVLNALQKVSFDWGVSIRSVQLKNVRIDP